VNVAGFTPQYTIQSAGCGSAISPLIRDQTVSYFPFVRLALARFQPHSVFSADGLDSAHLSRGAGRLRPAGPHRQVEYDLKDLQANGRFDITVTRPGRNPGSVHSHAGELRRRDPRVPDVEDELGWDGVRQAGLQTFQFGAHRKDTTWSGTIPLPSPQPSPLRVLVRELGTLQHQLLAAFGEAVLPNPC
jgi:hypothetical protein